MPLGGPYEPLAAAELLVWLAGETNGHITGQTIFIDGGRRCGPSRRLYLVSVRTSSSAS
jgi:hypothetical protein